MNFWVCKIDDIKTLNSGDERTIWHSSYSEQSISKNDVVFVADSTNPTLVSGWGKIKDFNIQERIVSGDDEEAHTPPFQTYFTGSIKVIFSKAFTLPVSLDLYLSKEDFDSYFDEYENEYQIGIKRIPNELVEKLKLFSEDVEPVVFLSYAREDLKYAKKLYNSLTDSGIRVWFDLESLLPGQNWKHEIQRAISESKAFIALLSNQSVSKKGYIQKEWRLGIEVFEEVPFSNIYLIPVRCEECLPKHPVLKEIHWVDIFPDYERGVKKIITSIKMIKT